MYAGIYEFQVLDIEQSTILSTKILSVILQINFSQYNY